MNDTTGNEPYGFELIPPFPLFELVRIVRSEFARQDQGVLIDSLLANKLPPLVGNGVLPVILGISPKLIHAMTHAPQRYYKTFQIEKKNGGVRTITTPKVFLKAVQRWILLNILYKAILPPYVTGFVPGRGTLTNASAHLGAHYLLKLDVKDFFPSIKFINVLQVFSGFGFPTDVSTLLSNLCILNGSLPQGAPTSPYLANLVFSPVDVMLKMSADRFGLHYSRYADDLTFSSGDSIPNGFIEEIRGSVQRSGFRINEDKTSISGPGQRLETTGVVVHVKAQPRRELRRKLRAMFHQARLHPHRFRKKLFVLQGWAAYLNAFDPQLGSNYLATAKRVEMVIANSSKAKSKQKK